MSKTWELIGPDRQPYASTQPGTLGGHRRSRIYGRLNCPAALRAIARGGYVTHRVFFLTEEHARSAGYRPCAVCLPIAYAIWKALQDDTPESRASSCNPHVSTTIWSQHISSPPMVVMAASGHNSGCHAECCVKQRLCEEGGAERILQA